MQKAITPPITGRLTGRAELNKIMLRQIYAVNNANPSARVKNSSKFAETNGAGIWNRGILL